jgi:hypothetical protein
MRVAPELVGRVFEFEEGTPRLVDRLSDSLIQKISTPYSISLLDCEENALHA